MDLKNTIDNTNKYKNNLKLGKKNIDNKLLELGGEKSINILDVPNKMGSLIDNYKKIAILNYDKKSVSLKNGTQSIDWDLKFEPNTVIIMGYYDTYAPPATVVIPYPSSIYCASSYKGENFYFAFGDSSWYHGKITKMDRTGFSWQTISHKNLVEVGYIGCIIIIG